MPVHDVGAFGAHQPPQLHREGGIGDRRCPRTIGGGEQSREPLCPARQSDHANCTIELCGWEVAPPECRDRHSMAAVGQLVGKSPNMLFHAAEVRMVEVGDHDDPE